MPTDQSERKIFHEIKNSITILNSTLSLLEKAHPEISLYDYWTDAKSELENLCEFIRLYQKDALQELSLKRIPVQDLINALRHRLRPVECQYDFTCKITQADHLPDIYADFYRVQSCLINLLKNSFEAMGKTGTVFMNISKEENFIRFDIQDFGGGISKEDEMYLFEPLFTTKDSGSGLGLSITRQYITEMHGVLICSSRLGDGTTFTMKLPIDKNEPQVNAHVS